MPKTATDLTSDAIRDVTRARTAYADDIAREIGRVDAMLDNLAGRRITAARFPSDAIPDAFYPDLVRLFAEIIAPNFGREANPETVVGMEERLRTLTRYATSDPVVLAILEQLEAFGAAIPALSADAIARRLPDICGELALHDVIYIADPQDLPDGAAGDFARYVAASLCNPMRVADMELAKARLRQLAPSPSAYPPLKACYW